MAIYTAVDSHSLEQLLMQYSLGTVVGFEALPEGIENSNYLLITERGQFVLTLFERAKQPSDLYFFFELMHHLARQGLPCPIPIYSHKQKRLHHICERPAVIVSFLEGKSLYHPQPKHCHALGKTLADIHIRSTTFSLYRKNRLSTKRWKQLFTICRDSVAADVASMIADSLTYVTDQWPQDLPKGVIHADLFPDNVLFQGDDISGVIDFYVACTDLLAYDLAICIDAWCFDAQGTFDSHKATQLIHGYTMRRPLHPLECAALPILLQGSTLCFLLTRLYTRYFRPPPTFGIQRDPTEYVLRLGFHQGRKTLTDYGILLK